ncbi:cation:proton antiporter [Streptomyces sp. NPDC058200]|uniref:cation:proton antiporter n=1 Tax=Streptomyces sp. NPDC058200 TaxID=3346378 RepID=UPI0036E4A9E3
MSLVEGRETRGADGGPDAVGDGRGTADEQTGAGVRAGRRRLLGYVLLVLVPVLAGGLALAAGDPAGPGTAARSAGSTTAVLLLAIGGVLVVALAAGTLAARIGQPRVMGEICAGLALGPSVLGQVAPDVSAWLFPPKVVTGLDALAQLGLVLFMFGVGQELARTRTTRGERGFTLVALGSLLVPFAAGTCAALWLAPRHVGQAAHPTAFALFLGCALSVTAFPVLARILSELGLLGSRTGRLSLYAAAVGDGICWVVLTVALTLAQGKGPGGQWGTLLASVLLVLVLLGPVRLGLARLLAGRIGRSPAATCTLCVAAVAASAGLTAALGIHQLIGAFLFGLAWPPAPARGAVAAASSVAAFAQLLLPFFFLGFGLSLDLGNLSLDSNGVVLLVVMLVLATLSKVVGAGLAGYLAGIPRTGALEIGVLMNTRGLTELVVLGIGHEAGLIDTQLFAVLVLVTLATTAMTGPGVRLMRSARAHRAAARGPDEARADRTDSEPAGSHRSRSDRAGSSPG